MTDAGLNVIVAEVAKGGGHGSLYSEADAQFQYEDYYKGSFNPSLVSLDCRKGLCWN